MNGAPVQINSMLSDVMGAKGLVGVPPEIAMDAIRKTAIDFCTQTTVWEYESNFDTQYNVADYPIYTPEGSRLASMKWVSVNGSRLNSSVISTSPNSFYACGCGFTFRMQDRDTLWISPTPANDLSPGCVEFCAALKPTQNACELPYFLVEDFNDALTSGAAFRLFAMPKQEFSNAGLAQLNQREYTRWIARARLAKAQNYGQRGLVMSGSYF